MTFWSLLGLDLLVIGFFDNWLNGLGLLLLTLTAFVYFLSRQKRDLQSLLIVFLDELAKEWRMLKMPSTAEDNSSGTASPASRAEVPRDAGSAKFRGGVRKFPSPAHPLP